MDDNVPDNASDFMNTDDESNGDADMGFVGILEPAEDDVVSLMLLQQVKVVGLSCVRERRQAMRQIVSEIYSPPAGDENAKARSVETPRARIRYGSNYK